jgi:hypothetical protein
MSLGVAVLIIGLLGLLGREPINLQDVRLARVRYAPIATKFRSAEKCRDVPGSDITPTPGRSFFAKKTTAPSSLLRYVAETAM